MFIKRKIIPIVHTNKFIHLSKVVKTPYTKSALLKPSNYLNHVFLNTMLYEDLDAYYYDTYPFYLEYLQIINHNPEIIEGFHFQKWDPWYYDCRITNTRSNLDNNGSWQMPRFVGFSPGIAHAKHEGREKASV
jgi:hypothetical protein